MKILVVGGGFAGRWLTWFLHQTGADVTLADIPDPVAATRVSAGVIKPVTGRRIVLTSKADEAIPFAFSTYQKLSEISGIEILRNKPVLQLFTSQGNRNDWMARSAEPELESFIGPFTGPEKMDPSVFAPFGSVHLLQSGFAEPASFESAIDIALKDHCEFIQTREQDEMPSQEGNKIRFRNQWFDKAVLCQGPLAAQQPLTSWIPFKPVKGEILDVSIPGLTEEYILSAGIYVVPYGDHRFRVGSTYEWDDLTTKPTEKAKIQLLDALEAFIRLPFQLTGHQAGVRPAIADRRPVIGWIPGHESIGVFNGLGTKGAMMGPYYAHQAAAFFTEGKPVDADSDLMRFSKFCQ